jgi:uncharacterized protein YjiS (DUF1127 family)
MQSPDDYVDLAILIGLLGNQSEQKAAQESMRQRYLRKIVAFIEHLSPYAEHEEICRSAEFVLAQFMADVQSGRVQNEAAVCSTLIKQSRREAAKLSGIEAEQSSDVPLEWKSQKRMRSALTSLSDNERLVLKEIVKTGDQPPTDLQIADTLAARENVLTVVEIRQARQCLAEKTKEVMS